MLFSETSPASPNIYHAKFYTSIAIPLLYILITILSLTSSPSLLLTFESIGYFLLTSFATQILRQEYKNIGKNSIYLKVFWTEFALFQVITSLLVGLCDKKIYFPVYLVLDIVACFMAALMLIAKENVTEKLLEYESVWNKFDSVTSEPKKKKEKKVWNNINHISLPAFVIDEESTVYFRILVVKGKHGEDCEELQRMAIEFNSLYEDFKRTHTKARIPNFPPKVPQR